MRSQLEQAEPLFAGYRRTLDALQRYLGLERQGDGEQLTIPRSFSGTAMTVVRFVFVRYLTSTRRGHSKYASARAHLGWGEHVGSRSHGLSMSFARMPWANASVISRMR